MWSELLLVGLVGAILGMDERAMFQGMLSHPLVVGTLVGLLVGDVSLGFEVGLIVGLFWSYALPVGGVVPPNGWVVAAAATALSAWMGGDVWVRTLSLLWATPFGVFAARFELGGRSWNLALARRCESASATELEGALWTVQGVGLFGALLFPGAGLMFALVSGALVLPAMVEAAPDLIRGAFAMVYTLLPFLGLGALVLALRIRRSFAILGVCFAGVLLWVY